MRPVKGKKVNEHFKTLVCIKVEGNQIKVLKQYRPNIVDINQSWGKETCKNVMELEKEQSLQKECKLWFWICGYDFIKLCNTWKKTLNNVYVISENQARPSHSPIHNLKSC